MPASDYRALQSQVRELQRLLDGCEAAKEREKIEDCQKQATEEKILPRDRPVVKCLDGATGPSQPSVVAPEYQELAAGRAKQKERVDNCQEQATEQKVLPRDRPQFVIGCLENRQRIGRYGYEATREAAMAAFAKSALQAA